MSYSLSFLLSSLTCLAGAAFITLPQGVMVSEWFLVDTPAAYLSLIAIVFTVVYLSLGAQNLSAPETACIAVSLVSCLFCFTTSNIFAFWVSYEGTIIPLLVSLYLSSPYSERFLAGWYLLMYVLLTSLPLLLLLAYMSLVAGSQTITEVGGTAPSWAVLASFVLFITKVPLPPFHAWLPIVHAEASTFVSVVLSGYVMKLGLIGILRLCWPVVPSVGHYVCACFVFSLLFYIASYAELDSKRWLAFLSLGHILVAILGVSFLSPDNWGFSVVFCLGHGVSAGLLFYLFGVGYESAGSRNWVVIGHSSYMSLGWRCLLVAGLLTVASFPPSISFVSEVIILAQCLGSLATAGVFSGYLFLGGLVPLVLLSYLLVGATTQSSSATRTGGQIALLAMFFLWLLAAACV
uniref:NADH dehydrogenase subunit 4 n=1 Tax=Dactylogyrus tuba TaxID=231340 RepID=UPI002E772AD9|nr:NADH dehydrogenase subunit 4 [Dactylogyrus tuba]WCF76307.1 NADH dehydrogenase subunit 4 [Dactylogyrus tuba]